MDKTKIQYILNKIGPDTGQYKFIVSELYEHFSKKNLKLLEVGADSRVIKDLIPKNITYHSLDFGKDHTYSFNLDNGRFPIKDEV